MKLKIDEFYEAEIVRDGRHLDYVFCVKEIVGCEYRIQTNDGEILHFYDREIKRFRKAEPFTFLKEKHVFRTKGVYKNLKKIEEPEF